MNSEMRARLNVLARGTGAVLLLGSPLWASLEAKPTVDRFTMPWIIEAGDKPFEIKNILPKTDITGARLLPLRLFVMDNDVVDPTGKLIVSKGTELGITASRVFAACTLRPPETKGLDSFAFLGADRYLCFVDEQRDGTFDYYFGMATPMSGVLAGQGKIDPSKPQNRVAGGTYTEINPSLSKQAIRVSVRYGSSRWFLSCIEGDAEFDSNCFGQRVKGRGKVYPSRFTVLGAEFEILSEQGKELRIRMLKPIAPQPVSFSY